MRTTNSRLIPKKIKLDSSEKYTRLFSMKNGDALSFRCGYVVLKGNENIGEHNTDKSEEILIVIAGKGELYIKGSEKISFEEGTALYVPPDTTHDVKNTGQSPLQYVFITCGVKRPL